MTRAQKAAETKLEKRHPFSFTLGPGPYQFVRLVQIKVAEGRGAAVIGRTDDVEAGIGTCAHCGHPIMDCYIVQTGEGKKFGVGSDCIGKVHADGDFTNISQFERDLRAAKRQKRQEYMERRRQAIMKTCMQLIDEKADLVAALPHPSEFHAKQGKTFKDYALWYRNRTGTSLGGWKLFLEKFNEAIEKVEAVRNAASDDGNDEVVEILDWIEEKGLVETFFPR